ncbi:MAG: TetR/AcrR family transcriptional regulator [Proteobacteria bacterium]|nr:TetR/AcrR family transcriptional regulator [Pseudomonadota bacterium]
MPKKPRTEEEIEEIKANILHHALELINQGGFEGFSMRKLARRLGVSVVTIYSYYKNKDDLYLAILTKGFEKLYHACHDACESEKEPYARLRKMVLAYVDFGFDSSNFYNLMFTWHVPKYEDYVGTPLENAAAIELNAGLQVRTFFLKAIREYADIHNLQVKDEDIEFYLIVFWSLLHGFIAGNNNKILSYMHDNPLGLKERILEFVLERMALSVMASYDNQSRREKGEDHE